MISLLRHGEIAGGKRFRGSTNDPLTAKGLSQMQMATSGLQCDAIVSSPLCRCAFFAKQLAHTKSLPLHIEPHFSEMHFGEWEGRTSKEVYDQSPKDLERFWSDPQTYPPPGGERLLDFRARILAAFEEMIAHHKDQHILLVTHGGVIRILMCHLQDIPLDNIMELDVDYGALIPFKRAGKNGFKRMRKS